MVKENNDEILKELREKLLANKIIIGTNRVSKELKNGNISLIYFASNCSDAIKSELQQHASLSKTPLVELSLNNEELGVFCKKNYFVSVLGTIKE